MPVYSYGVALVFALSLCTWRVLRRLPSNLLSFNDIANICLISMAAIFFGNKTIAFLVSSTHSIQTFSRIFKVWEHGSLSVLWAFLFAIGFIFLYCRLKRISFLATSDFLLPHAIVGIGVQRLFGCFLAGCCYGMPTDMPWGLVFSERSPAGKHFPHLPLHPTQLYYGIAMCALVEILAIFEQQDRRPGKLTAIGLIGFGLTYFLISFWRGDRVYHAMLFGLTGAQYIAICLLCGGLILYRIVK